MIYLRFILLPIYNLIYSLNNLRSKDSKFAFFLFILFYSFCLSLPNNGFEEMDLYRRIELFKYVNSNLSWENLFSGNIFENFLMLLVSSFTENWRFMSLIWGSIIGYFNTQIIWHVIDNSNQRFNNFTIKILILFLICSLPFWNIGVFRFFAAANIFVYALLKYFQTQNYLYFIFGSFSIFIHWSFLFAYTLIPFFLILKMLNAKKLNYWLLLILNLIFIISIFYNFFGDLYIIRNLNFDYLPQFFNQKATAYSSDIFIDRLVDLSYTTDNNFYVRGRYYLIYIIAQAVFLYYLKRRKYISEFLKIDFYFVIIFSYYFIFNQLGDFSPFDRYSYIPNFFLANLIFIFLEKFKNFKYYFFYKYSYIFLLIYIIVEIRNSFDTMSILAISSNPIISPFLFDINFSLIDLFK